MRVLGISIGIYFLWIFIVGILLFFYTVHGTLFEGFVVGSGSGSGSGSELYADPYSINFLAQPFEPSSFIEKYDPNTQQWSPLTESTDRFLYFQKFSVGAQITSPNGVYALAFKPDGTLVLYNTTSLVILWQRATTADARYLFHSGHIQVIDKNNAIRSSPFIPPTASNPSAGSWSGSAMNLSAGSMTSSYLQILDNANLVLYAADGTMLFSTNTAIEQIKTPCAGLPVLTLQSLPYPLTQSDCFNLKSQITDKRTKLADHTAAGRTIEIDAVQNSICMIESYYNILTCDAYIASHTPSPTLNYPSGSSSGSVAPITPPNVTIYGSVSRASKQITVTGDLTASVNPGDMIYLGYGTDIQGPFVVESLNATSLTITKRYVGADIVNAVISSKPVSMDGTKPSLNAVPLRMKSGSDILASIYPGESYINIKSTNSASSSIVDSLPMNLQMGDLVYVKGPCNTYTHFTDIDNGDGTCTTYTCKPGELDLENGKCKPFSCGSTYNGFSTIADTDNKDGTCSTPIVYNGCNGSDTYDSTANTCTNTLNDGTTLTYIPPTSASISRYDVTIKGVAGTEYVKNSSNQSYKYSKTMGPYIVAMMPATNKIMIKSFKGGDLDLSGNFKLNPTAEWRRRIKMFANHRIGVTQGSPQIQSISSIGQTITNTVFASMGWNTLGNTPPAVVTTVDLTAVPEGGYTNGKIYKVLYNDGVYLGSYTSISAGTNAGNMQTTSNNSIRIDSSTASTESKFTIHGINLLVGQKYLLKASVKSTVVCTMYLESAPNQYYTIDSTTGITGVTTTTDFSNHIWVFYAVTSSVSFRVVKPSTATVTFEFNLLNIEGGIAGATKTLACKNGTTTTAGLTECNP
jgi:hypothetical protein